jgi:hypothetical protein
MDKTWSQCNRINCPLKKDAEETVKLGGETLRAIRRLRRKMQYCPDCPDYHRCPVLAEFNATVDQVLQEIHEEWDLK